MNKKTKLTIGISVFIAILLSVVAYVTIGGYADEPAKKDVKVEEKAEDKDNRSSSNNDTGSDKKDVKESELKTEKVEKGYEKEIGGVTFTILHKNIDKNTVVADVLVSGGKSNEQFITVSKDVNTLLNEEGEKNVTVQVFLSKDGTSVAQFTFDNLSGKKQALLKRTYSFPEKEVQYGRVDYQVLNASVSNGIATISVLASHSASDAMFDISKELSQLIKETNTGLNTVNVSFFASSENYQANAPQWVYTDNASTQIKESSSFGY